jgi:outer membrane receptor protein involved in Fe transport
MVSIGDWIWKNDVSGIVYDDSGNELETIAIYSKDLKVSDAAQTTFAVGLNFKVMEKSTIFADYNYAGDLYAEFDVLRRDDPDYRIDSWKMPEYGLFDVGIRHGFKIGEFDTTLTGTMNNIFDTEYISDGRDGGTSTEADATVYYGTGRTFSFGLKMKF